ncbi:hypothetical protein NECAME_05941 [Necator americanus]|uniref:Uncharacterized protein n=1 Tax=Necator americanus TaxID=51031 RepID=W2TZR8_NECAM|nr:hypothetical protein NECAME_05941 [Necator americanus]ETN86537.1 hypothetical protein NECAME_05941 [Necator americanus]
MMVAHLLINANAKINISVQLFVCGRHLGFDEKKYLKGLRLSPLITDDDDDDPAPLRVGDREETDRRPHTRTCVHN